MTYPYKMNVIGEGGNATYSTNDRNVIYKKIIIT